MYWLLPQIYFIVLKYTLMQIGHICNKLKSVDDNICVERHNYRWENVPFWVKSLRVTQASYCKCSQSAGFQTPSWHPSSTSSQSPITAVLIVAMRTNKVPLFEHEKKPCRETSLTAETFTLIIRLKLAFTADFSECQRSWLKPLTLQTSWRLQDYLIHVWFFTTSIWKSVASQ